LEQLVESRQRRCRLPDADADEAESVRVVEKVLSQQILGF
jgi:hypothetical protein